MRSQTAQAIMLLCCAALVLSAGGCSQRRTLAFPEDHGPHFDCASEWWYFTGEAADGGGEVLGFECTIFKTRSSGANSFAYLGHMAVSIPSTQEYLYGETLTRPPVDGVFEHVPRLAVSDYTYDFSDNATIALQAVSGDARIDLALVPRDDVLLHGNRGSIIMGDGLPSYYYSYTDLETSGVITVHGRPYVIDNGRTWMDHQWGDFSALGLIWDWFSLRLADGSALMLFRFRNIAGGQAGADWTYRSAAGAVSRGSLLRVQSQRTYRDPGGYCAFPLGWSVAVPDIDAEFTVTPLFDNQIFFSAMTPDYWEGLCSAAGSVGGIPVTGSAYVELTGYCKLFTGTAD